MYNLGAVQREGALHANTEADLAHGEGLTGAAAAHADDIALKHLLTLALTLLDVIVHLYIVAHADLGKVLANLLALDGTNVVHGILVSRGVATA